MMTAEPKRTMLRFLLGEMSAQERAGFEDEYIRDTDLFQNLVELENDLIDLYAMGALSRSVQKRLERSFLADPERRKRLSFARALVNSPGGETPVLSSELLKAGIRPRWFHSASPALLPIAAVLLLAMLSGISWLVVANGHLRIELQSLQKQHAEELKAVARSQKEMDALTKELDVRSRSGMQTAQGTSTDLTLLSFTLKADSLRSNSVMPRLIVPSTATSVELHLIFPSDRVAKYNIFVETANGTPIWHKDNAKGRPTGAGSKKIVVMLPTRLLKNGDYVVQITASSSRGTEDVAGYSFSVLRN
jgi:hypothetical protein